MNTMRFDDMNDMIKASVKDSKYTGFAIYDKTHEAYIGSFTTPEEAVDVANSICPHGCRVLWVVAVISDNISSIPFYLRDIANDYCLADTRIVLFEVYDDAREKWESEVRKSKLGEGRPFEEILFNYARGYTGKEFVEYLNDEYSFDHESAIVLIENIIKFARTHYDDNESAVCIAKFLMDGAGITKEDLDLLQTIK